MTCPASRGAALLLVAGLLTGAAAAAQVEPEPSGAVPAHDTAGGTSAATSRPPPVAWVDALARAEDPPDFLRILDEGPPELWDAAAIGLLGEKDGVPVHALVLVRDRVDSLGPEARARVSAALARADEERRQVAESHRLPGERDARPGAPPEPARTPAGLVGLLVVSAWLGLVVFLWGLRLLRLRRLVLGLPVSTARSLALGQVAVQGEAQPLDGVTLQHPETGEVCVYVEGAAERVAFCVVDDTGAVAVDPAGAVLLSADGVIVPGERVHVIGQARRTRSALDPAAGPITVAASQFPRSAFQKVSQWLVGSVMGGLFGRGSARMLFSDPLRCFWIWDDLHTAPFSTPRETVVMVAAFFLAGGWILVFLAAAVALLGG